MTRTSPTYRLTDNIARRRLLYPSLMIGVPHLLLIDLPLALHSDTLLLGRYYPVLLETEDEIAEMETFLTEPRDAPEAPARFDRRPSGVVAKGVMIAQYDPPARGWPWVVACRWAPMMVESAGTLELARGCYTTDAFPDREAMIAHCAELIARLGQDRALELRMISADQVVAGGSA